MDGFIHVEPAHEQRPAFALWGLDQFPPLGTASAQGWDVPLDLYVSIPPELLAGAYVDGYPHDVPQPQPAPVAAAVAQQTAGERPQLPEVPQAARNPLAAERKPLAAERKPRKRATRKPTTSERADSEMAGGS